MAAPPIVERHKHHFHRQAPIKESVRAATTADITIATALNNADTLDGVTLATGDRVLVKDQGTGSQNGIYVVGASPARDYDVSTDDPAFGYLVLVREGTANVGKVFRNSNTSAPTIGTTALTFVEFGAGGGGGTTVDIEDEGAAEGAADTIDFTGAGVSVSFAAGTATVDIPGGGGGALPAAKAWLEENEAAEDYPASPNATYDDEFNDDTGMSGSGNGLNARWNWRNQGSATTTFGTAGYLSLNAPAQASNNFRIIEIAALADGTYEALVSLEGRQALGASVGEHGGIVLVDGTNGDFYLFGIAKDNATVFIGLQRWTNVTTFNSNPALRTLGTNVLAPKLYLRVTKATTTLTFYFSPDGIAWTRCHTEADAVSATRIGLAVNESSNSGTTKLLVDYFRKTA